MRWLERLELRCERLAFPGLMKYLTMLGVLAYACQWARPDIADVLDFDRARIAKGEVWRIFSFLVAPMGLRSFSPLGVLFLYCAVRISFLISDSLEAIWGPTKLTLYIFAAWMGLFASHFIFNIGPSYSGELVYTSLFFAFATCFPKVQFLLFFILPVEVRWFAWLGAVLLGFACFQDPYFACLVVPALVPYALWVLPEILRGKKRLAQAAVRRRQFEVAQRDEREPFHRCETCGRTEIDSADLEFRVLPDGREYCTEHLP